ncbi:hypothetical protein MPK71_gp198 [Erwinia phage pEa_SNUABM_1]|uniref:Uncharacterized protein n=1 Tax=Erwinia phage pEa_SNUABM_1 TaxID=2869543 RepID=A0AAE7XLA8_9CAUD|nr:hypothetical protein MPK71_gp198 [Erwinia phage pEa_SNUABM_1]QZE57407.1 hypothetical protein pEaSNUABM1_00198 [Erwinia phage pEa_SNUABM_1]
MSLIKLNLEEAVKSQSAAAINAVFGKLTKKEFFELLDDGMPSDLGSANDIVDFRFISYKNGTARFGMITKDEDEEIGYNISGIDIRLEPEFDDDDTNELTLADAKKALARLR